MAKAIDLNLKKRSLIYACMLLSATICAGWLNSSKAGSFRTEVRESILRNLVNIQPLPPGKTVDVVYVLGGTQRSLEYKYQAAADVCNKNFAKAIWFLSRPGITEYSLELGRNYTNDEWSLSQLKKLGVPKEKIEKVEIEKGFFGTLSEAKHVSKIVRQRGCTNIMLIAQTYHTQRVYISFKKHLPQENFAIYIINSSESQRLWETVIELIKLKVYEYWLLR